MRRDTTASSKLMSKTRNRNTIASASPFSTKNNLSIMSRNFSRFRNYSIWVTKADSNPLHKQRIYSQGMSANTSFSIDYDPKVKLLLNSTQVKPSSQPKSPHNRNLKNLKAEVKSRKKSTPSWTRPNSNKRNFMGQATTDSKPTNVTSSETPFSKRENVNLFNTK